MDAKRFLLAALFAAACAPKDDGEVHIGGVVVLPPTERTEADDAGNAALDGAEPLVLAPFGSTWLDGKLATSGVDAAGEPTGDLDWYAVDFKVPGTLEFELTTTAATAVVRASLYDKDVLVGDPPAPALVDTADLGTGGRVRWDGEPNHHYGLRLAGLASLANVGYHLDFAGPSPDDAGFLVGAYADPTLADAREPLGGAACGPFTEEDDGSFTAPYEIQYLAVVDTPPVDPEADHAPNALGAEYDDAVAQAWLFAGTFDTLNAPLGSGTFYSSAPVRVKTADDGVIPADPLVIDALAPGGIGHTYLEVEPNDAVVSLGGFSIDAAGAQDVGLIDGAGFTDLFLGDVEIFSADVGLVHDNDAFAFTVPEPVVPSIHLDWEDPAVSMLVAIYDQNGLIYDFSATTGQKPAVGGGAVTLAPGKTWYLGLGGYAGPVGARTAYTLELSLEAP